MVEHLFPHWARTLGAMAARPIHVRSQCRGCGVELRVDVEALCAKLGPLETLIDRTDRCSMVGCQDPIFYKVSLPFRDHWLTLVTREETLTHISEGAAPKVNAVTLRMDRQNAALPHS